MVMNGEVLRTDCEEECFALGQIQNALAQAQLRLAGVELLIDEAERRLMGYKIEKGVHLRHELEASLERIVDGGSQPQEYATNMLERLELVEPEFVAETVAGMLLEIHADMAFKVSEAVFNHVVSARLSQEIANDFFTAIDREAAQDAELVANIANHRFITSDDLPGVQELRERKILEQEAIQDLRHVLKACRHCPGPGYEVSDDFEGPTCQAPFEPFPLGG